MFATRTTRLGWEMVKWAAILMLAGALAWLMAMQTAAGATPDAPRLPREALKAAPPELRGLPHVHSRCARPALFVDDPR